MQSKLFLTALVAALALSAATSTASADTGLAASPNEFVVFFEDLQFEAGDGIDILCDVEMNVTLHASLAKIDQALAGFTEIEVRDCDEGNAGLLDATGDRATGLIGPFHVVYKGFTGELPNIESVILAVEDVPFWIEPGGSPWCLVQPELIMGATLGGNPADGLTVNENVQGLRGGFFCIFTEGEMIGNGAIYADKDLTDPQPVTIELL